MEHLDTLSAASVVVEAARGLMACPWDRVDGVGAVALAESVCVARRQLDAALLRVVPLLEGSTVLRDAGWASSKDFLTHLLGGHQGAGSGLIRVVEQLSSLPVVQSALEDGSVTLPQARVIASKVHTLPRVAAFRTAVAERMLVLVATEGSDASELSKAFDGIVADLDPNAEIINTERRRAQRERAVHQARHLSFSEDGYGGVRLKGYGTVEDVEAIKATLFPLAAPVTNEPGACGGRERKPGEPLFDEEGVAAGVSCPDPGCAHDGRDVRDHGARLWDALVEACDRLRGTEGLPRDHGSVARVVVTIDHDSLREEVIDAGLADAGVTSTDAHLSATSTRRIACDAEIIPVILGAEGQPLDVGRAKRLVTPGIWTALITRDQHCGFPGCTRMPLACDAHHIVHWADGGATSLDNMIMLCRHHHTLIHQSPWKVRIERGRPVWTPPPRLTLASLEGKLTYHPAHPRVA